MAALSPGQAINQAITHTVPVIGDDFYRWPVPAVLSSKIPDVEAEETAYSYDPFLGGSPAVHAWDYAFDHSGRKLVVRYEHRDLSTSDDDRVVRFTWNPVSPTLGYWYQLVFEQTSDRNGVRLTRVERSQFSGFDSPRVVRTCGKSSSESDGGTNKPTDGADCETDQYKYFPNGTLETHTRPDQSFESWTRLAWCGEPLTYRDPAGRVTTFTRDTGGDAKCLTKSILREGATWTYSHDTLLRPIKLVVDPGAGESATATITTYYYDDALTYQSTVRAREDWNYVEPRRAERRGDGQLQRYFTDGLGRIAKHIRCSDTGTDTTGGDISLVACSKSTVRTLAWNLYGTDGLLKVAVAPFKSEEVPVTTGFGHDGQNRPIVVMKPVHAADVVDWRVDTIKYGAGYEERTEPTAGGRVVTRRQHSTLGEALTVGGASRGSLTRGLVDEVTSVTAADGKTTRLSYDDRWQLASEQRVDATGLPVREKCVMPDGTTQLRPYEHRITERDLRGRVTEEVLPDDTVLSHAYDNVDRIVRREVNGVPVRSYTYISPTLTKKGTVRVTDELGGSSATSSIDGLGRGWLETAPRVANRSEYDTAGRLVSTTDIDNLTTQYFYDIHDTLTSVVTPATGTTTYARDGAGRITAVTDADDAVETYSYTYSGALYRHRRGPHLVTEHAYDARGLVVAAVENGVDTAMTYDDLGRLTKRREGVDGASELRVTTYSYDAGDRVTEVRRTPVAGLQTASTLFHYDGWGRPSEEIDPAGLAIQRSFDAAGRIRRVRDQEGAVLETAYDDLGRITDRQVPGGGWEHFRYHGKQTHVGEPNVWRIDQYGDEDFARGVKTQRFVDGSGHLLTELQPNGTRTVWTRPTGRVTREELFTAGGTPKRATDYAYDETTGLLASRTQGPYAVSYEYTAAGRLARTITPDDALARTYANGLLASTTEAGVQRRYGRDKGNGWIVTEARQVGTGAIRSADIERDRLGRIGRIEWSSARTTPHTIQTFALHDYYNNAWLETNQGVAGSLTAIEASTFDVMGRPLTRTTSGAGLPRKTVSWTWYDNGRLESVTTPSSKLLEYDYGAPFDHQLDSVTLDGAVIAQVNARDLRGSITSMTLPPVAQTRTFRYDDNGRVVSRTTGPLLPMLGFEWNATFNADGTLATETIDDHAGGNGWENAYTYDGVGRLIAEIAGKTELTIAYVLDAAGNRKTTTVTPLAGPQTVTTAGYDGPKLTTVGTTALVYDAWNAVAVDHHGNTYTRSADGELTTIRGGSATVFARNARRIPVAAVEPGLITRRTTWALSAASLPLEVDEGDGMVLTYLSIEGTHIGTAVNGAFVSIDADDRWTELRHGTEVLGAATAFGVGTSAPPGSDERFGYAMLERVPSAAGGVMLARRRTYDPTIGRFHEPDPIGSDGGLEVYQYAHGNPNSFVDPMGTAALGTDCSNGGTPVIGRPSIEPMTAQTMSSGIPEATTDPQLFAHLQGASGSGSSLSAMSNLDLDVTKPFPNPGPLCVVNCDVIINTGGPDNPDSLPQPPSKPVPPPEPEAEPPPEAAPVPAPEGKKTSPFAGLGELVKDFLEKVFSGNGRDESLYKSPLSKTVQAVHETVWGTEAREAVGREALKRGSDWVTNMRGAPTRALEGARQLGNQFRNDPVGTTVSVGTTVAREVTWDMVVGTFEDAIQGGQEYGTGLWNLPPAAYDLYTAEDDAARQDAAERMFDAGGNLASGSTKLVGPLTTALGVGVAGRAFRGAARGTGRVLSGPDKPEIDYVEHLGPNDLDPLPEFKTITGPGLTDPYPTTKQRGTTSRGHRRNNPKDWRRYRDTLDQIGLGDAMSDKMRQDIGASRAPTADQAWNNYFPDDPVGEKLTMHHIFGTKYTEPVGAGPTGHTGRHLYEAHDGHFRNPGALGWDQNRRGEESMEDFWPQ